MNSATNTVLRIEDVSWQQEALSTSQWATILSITPRAFALRNITHTGQQLVKGGLTKVYSFESLPEDYRTRLVELRDRHRAGQFGDLLDIRRVETRWVPQREWMTYPEATRERALKVRAAMQVFYRGLDLGQPKEQAKLNAMAEWLRQFGEACNECTIRRWAKLIDERGGFEWAPNEAYCDNKSCKHEAARRHVKLSIPLDLIAEYKDRCTKTEHISAAFRSLELDWMMGREVPGLGTNDARMPFPYKARQFRDYAPATATRRLGSHGKARARRESLPAMTTTTAQLRRGESYVLDDTRIDIIATDDLTGQPVQLKSYWMIDRGPRRIEGFVLRQVGNIRSNDVDSLVARVLRGSGLARIDAGYKTTIQFERGTVACSPATKSFLLGAFPGRLDIKDTSMDGGKNHAGDFTQAGSGHWMGKAHVESFMRTVAYFLEHVPGQRGGHYRRQPAQLGLKGRNKETDALDYERGSRIHEAALLEYSNRALEWVDTGTLAGHAENRRLKVSALWPVSWVMQALKEFVAYYNARTDHRMEGFARIEYQDKQTGALKHRMESPNERAAVLDHQCPTERISASDAAFLLSHTAKTVTVRAATAKPGVVIDLAPWKGLQFWRQDSLACHEAGRLTTLERKHVALFDPEAIAHWTPECGYVPEMHILSGNPGEPGCRYLETLPLHSYADRTDETDLAKQAAEFKKIEQRTAAELLRAAAPSLARRISEAKENITHLQGIVASPGDLRPVAESSELVTEAQTAPTRRAYREAAQQKVTKAEAEAAQQALYREER